MNRRLLTALTATAIAAGGLATTIARAGQPYCDPLAGCAGLGASPSTVVHGHVTRIHGTVAGGCQLPGIVTVYSRAFRGATKQSFAGVPAFYAHANNAGAFSFRVRISRHVKAGRYHIGGRCGGGNFGSATLRVTA